ncbi:MAG: hypothetical protein SPK09_04770 [Porphyromonas sp.]|nr:hypothetical protein [Porphyromonas sp.]
MDALKNFLSEKLEDVKEAVQGITSNPTEALGKLKDEALESVSELKEVVGDTVQDAMANPSEALNELKELKDEAMEKLGSVKDLFGSK